MLRNDKLLNNFIYCFSSADLVNRVIKLVQIKTCKLSKSSQCFTMKINLWSKKSITFSPVNTYATY